MSERVKFLNPTQVVALHERHINLFGGLPGIKDEALLLSALGQPAIGLGDNYLHEDFYEKAAAYFYHLVKNHAFNDGNKRIAVLVSVVFLEINGLIVTAREQELEKLVRDAAEGLASKEQITAFFRKHAKKTHHNKS